jgi:endonuclease YncB( thermonuclease family)
MRLAMEFPEKPPLCAALGPLERRLSRVNRRMLGALLRLTTMRAPTLATALAALAAVLLPLPGGATGPRGHAPAGIVPLRPHAQPIVQPLARAHAPQAHRHAPHAGAGHPRYPNAHLMPGLVVHPPHRHWRYVAAIVPVGYGFIPYAPLYLTLPTLVIDGDTFDSGGVRYRLYGIDTPELHEPLGPQARDRLQQLLAMGPVTVVPVALDVYGRTLARVIAAGYDVAAVLRAEGFAKG